MNIKRTPALSLFLLAALSASARAVTISGTVDGFSACSIDGGLYPTVIVVTTSPVTDPALALDPAVLVSSMTGTGPTGIPFSFSLLPYAPASYHVFAFREGPGGNNIPDSVDCMGGWGPFPFHDPASSMTAVSPGDIFNGVGFSLYERSVVSGYVTNTSAQAGQRVVVRAIEDIGAPNFDLAQRVDLPLAGGAYTLEGIKPTANPYRIEAWVDTELEGAPGEGNPDLYEDQAPMLSVGILTGGGALTEKDLAVSSLVSGGSAPDHVRIDGPLNSWRQVMSSGSVSAPLVVSVRDYNDVLASTSAATDLQFFARQDGISFTPLLSTDDFSTTTTTLTVPADASYSPVFKFKAEREGVQNLLVRAQDFPVPGETRYAYYNFEVLPEGAGFTASVRNASSIAGSSSASITPDWDGLNDAAIFSCAPPRPDLGWELVISSDLAFGAGIVRSLQGWGAQEVYWYGDGPEGPRVKNGTYYARFQTAGQGIVSSTMAVDVETAFVKGNVTNGAGISVNVYGNGGGSYLTDPDGSFFVGGLIAGSSYTVQLNGLGLEPVSFFVAASSDVGTITLSSGSTVRVHVAVDSAPVRDVYGWVSAHTTDYSSHVNGTVHLAALSTESDNGLPSADVGHSSWTLLGLRPGAAYSMDIDLPDFGRTHIPFTAPAGGFTLDISTAMFRRANISGLVRFPAPLPAGSPGQWVTVDALPEGEPRPTAWGGAWVDSGASSATYNLYGVAPGSYTLRAIPPGHRPGAIPGIIVGSSNLFNVDFATFTTGGKITGHVAVAGEAVPGTGSTSLGPVCAVGSFPVVLNAYSPTTFVGASAQVCVVSDVATRVAVPYELTGLVDGTYQIFTNLTGFQVNPARPTATVAGSIGTRDLVFQALTGALRVQAILPPGLDPMYVSYQVSQEKSDFSPLEGMLGGPAGGPGTALVSRLGTGLYHVVVRNEQNGFRQEAAVAVVNGQTATVDLDMTAPSYSVSGNVSLIGNAILPSPWGVTVSSLSGLSQVLGQPPVLRVYSLPLPDHFEPGFGPEREIPLDVYPDSATYTLSGMRPGGYLLRLAEDLNPPEPSCVGCDPAPGLPDLASSSQLVFVGTAGVMGADLAVTNGAKLTGVIRRPAGDGSTDARAFTVRLRRTDNLSVWETQANTTGVGSAPYGFAHLAPGSYVLEVREESSVPKYAAKAQPVTIAEGDAFQDITLWKAARVVGRLRDADSDTLINAQNASLFLPDNFGISAQANPWVPGGYVEGERSADGPGPAFDANTGQFVIARLIPDTQYDIRLRTYGGGASALLRGQRLYAPVVLSGVKPAEGQTVDLGTISLYQGGVLSGSAKDPAGNPLPNVRIKGRPSQSNGGDTWQYEVETFTDAFGNFQLAGVDRGQRYYDVIAAPRYRPGEPNAKLAGARYAEERIRMVDVSTGAAQASALNFTLVEANGVLVGRVKTPDPNGVLVPAFEHGENQEGQRGADVVLHREGAFLDENPLGEIEERSAADGAFRIEGLRPGAYTVRGIALGYGTALKTLSVAAGVPTYAGDLLLTEGGKVSGVITKPDGSPPSDSEVGFVVGVDENFEDFLFGAAEINGDTHLVTGYSLSGFKPGKNYSLLIVSEKDDILEAQTDVLFADGEAEKVINLLFRRPPPKVFVNQSRFNNLYTLRFFCNQPLRNVTDADNDLAVVATVAAGAGSITERTLAPARDFLTVVYAADPAEPSFKVALDFHTGVTDPESPTGEAFHFSRVFDFFTGIGRRRSVGVPNLTGGDCDLEGDPSGATFEAGAFDVERSSTVDVGIQSALTLDEAASLSPAWGRQSPAAALASRFGPAAFPSRDLYLAAAAAPTVDPFRNSGFYDLFLPAGVSHMLKSDALLTLSYDEDVTDPSKLNIYYFDPAHNVFLLEKSGRVVDEVNRTVTVAVSHLSTFVILESQAPIIGGGSYAGAGIYVHNVPNPFNLKPKTVTLADAAIPSDQTTEGTFIKFGLPAGKTGEVKIEIHDVAGALVRTLTASGAAGSHHYLEWNGRNDGGQKVASGVYLARFTLNGGDEKIFKLAVIK